MTKREKYQYTYEAVQAEIRRIETELANELVDNAHKLGTQTFNTMEVHQQIGALKTLRQIIFP